MKVQIAKWGNSAAVRLPKAVMEELGLTPGQKLDLTIENGEARLKPAERKPDEKLQDLIAEMRRLGSENIPRYEDWGILPPEWPSYDGPGPDEWEDETSRSG